MPEQASFCTAEESYIKDIKLCLFVCFIIAHFFFDFSHQCFKKCCKHSNGFSNFNWLLSLNDQLILTFHWFISIKQWNKKLRKCDKPPVNLAFSGELNNDVISNSLKFLRDSQVVPFVAQEGSVRLCDF